jgi:hypothetical protein
MRVHINSYRQISMGIAQGTRPIQQTQPHLACNDSLQHVRDPRPDLLRRVPCHIRGLRSFRPLDNLEFNRIPFIQGLVTLGYDRRVMDKHIRTSIAPDEAITFRIVEPLDRAFHVWAQGNEASLTEA